ncbi:cupin domain-containing protein [Polaromonas sp. C04]|uniref:cupin domain-containing protein n=1 Tax=Polaromonas sp. C04 TaxID=1945857 RepID=UPI000987CDE3|nr:cupin domain-containing protein [Polaromonas sp. C04]OOG56102.1 cupin [Polaromonas sp. C04]
MDITQPLALLGGLSPQQFMKRHWQKKPLLVRQALAGMAGFAALLDRAALFALAGGDDVESRLVTQGSKGWRMRSGPFRRRALPPLGQPGWTLLVQGVDLHVDAAYELLQQFRFVPEARLDDLMVSYAVDGGGVGPHFDSYDVFLLQAHGRRRWRIGRQQDLTLQEGVPLKVLANFVPEQEFVLEPGDLLYLPPRYAHDGVAVGECMTYSIGFRAPQRGEIARELLQRLAEDADEAAGDALYRDADQPAADSPGRIPAKLQDFARHALQAALKNPLALPRALGEYLTEPKASVWFEPAGAPRTLRRVALDRRTRMMFDDHHVFINGESYRAGGRDATLMRRLADHRRLEADDLLRASEGALSLLASWYEAGWLHEPPGRSQGEHRSA